MIYYEFEGDVCIAKYTGFKPNEIAIGIKEDYPIELVKLNYYKLSEDDPPIIALKPVKNMSEMEELILNTMIAKFESEEHMEIQQYMIAVYGQMVRYGKYTVDENDKDKNKKLVPKIYLPYVCAWLIENN